MKINFLYIKNIRSLEDVSITFGKTNLITGWNKDTNDKNGVGKSSIIESILVLIGGSKLISSNLSDLITNDTNEAKISGVIETSCGHLLEITRILSRKNRNVLNVKIDGEDQNCKTPSDYQNLIFDYIDNLDNFKKFRIIDKSTGINVLDFTSGQLRKTLMSLCQQKFDAIRQRLLDKKRLFEKYNKSSVLHPYFPSINRLSVLECAIEDFNTTEIRKINKKIRDFQKERRHFSNKKGKIEQEKYSAKKAKQRLEKMDECYACYQKVEKNHKEKQFKRLNEIINESDKELNKVIKKIKMYEDIVRCEDKKQTSLYIRKEKLNNLKNKLETRIKQKDFKYTDADIQIAKKAIEEVDRFSNYYILQWINTIEPIVNNYLKNLNMELHFNPDEKARLNIELTRNNKTYKYCQLSQGEKIFVSFIFKIALLLENNESGLIIADEGLDSLSVENIDKLIYLSNGLPIQLILVSHNPDVNLKDVKKIELIKENDKANIKEK